MSILLAFGIDAWWDSLGERERRVSLVQSLQRDFEAAAADLARVRSFHERVVEAAEGILEHTDRASFTVGEALRLDTLVTNLLWEATFDPPTGALEALLSTGTLEILENDELVSELIRWRSHVFNLQREESLGEAQAVERLHPYLGSRIRVRNLYTSRIGLPVPWSVEPAESHTLISDVAFENLVVRRWDIYSIALRALSRVEASTDRVQHLLGER